jgi:hypothetical protein
MFFDPGTDVIKPNFTDMGGKTGPQNITQIVDRLGDFQLPQAEQSCP